MTNWSAFFDQFEIWPVARPYVGLMFDEREIGLVLALGERALTANQIASILGLELESAHELVDRCYRRLIVDKEGTEPNILYRATDFYTFLDHFLKFEDWDDIPLEDRRAIDRKYLLEFAARVEEGVALKMEGKTTPDALPNDSVLLLHEVEAMIDAATDVVVQPCNCRRAGQFCDRPVETCIWLDEGAREALDRGHGRALGKEEAKELLRWADRKGLMHTADSEWQTRGLHAICNCCACDCYPFRAAEELGSKGAWPKIRYLAEYDAARCSLCGSCVRRCHFGAFYHDGSTVRLKGKDKETVSFDPDKCWGCGLCANTCPTDAIVMMHIDEERQVEALLRPSEDRQEHTEE
jgi:NAD-dependent dihydropyrimidine dehydrogenase PreA subunit